VQSIRVVLPQVESEHLAPHLMLGLEGYGNNIQAIDGTAMPVCFGADSRWFSVTVSPFVVLTFLELPDGILQLLDVPIHVFNRLIPASISSNSKGIGESKLRLSLPLLHGRFPATCSQEHLL
jgi:hypothetical protein